MPSALRQPRADDNNRLVRDPEEEAPCASPRSPGKLLTIPPYGFQRQRKATRKNGSAARLTQKDLQVRVFAAAAAGCPPVCRNGSARKHPLHKSTDTRMAVI